MCSSDLKAVFGDKAKDICVSSIKSMKVLQQDTPLTYEYAGQVKGKNEVKVQPRVSGTVVEKYVTGGQFVTAGQPLYKLDSRQYESAVLSAQATLAQSEATLNNAQIDLQRDQELLASAAIAEQEVTTQQSKVNQYAAAAAANQALLKKAQENLDDTVVYAPMSGRLNVDDVAVGTYASAGQTALVTIGTVDPVFVQFSISETEYLKFMLFATSLGIFLIPVFFVITEYIAAKMGILKQAKKKTPADYM